MPNSQSPDPAAHKLQELLNQRAEAFAKEFAHSSYEMGRAQSFVTELCGVYGLNYLRAVDFEYRIKKAGGSGINRIDSFFPGLLLVEMKSSGKDLAEAYRQAKAYIPLLKNSEDTPRYLLVSDFQNLHLYDLESQDESLKFRLADFREHVNALDFLLGYERIYQQVQERINSRAAGVLSRLHDELKKARYPIREMQSLLVRILFCLFGDDTQIFGETRPFAKLIDKSLSNGEGLGDSINRMFKRLNTPENDRLDAGIAFEELTGSEQTVYPFPYVNGSLFEIPLEPANFTEATRNALLDCCHTDWSLISPDIFGTMFQNIMHWEDEEAGSKSGKRRDFGAHYTSERNIRRAIDPLFLDDLRHEIDTAKALEKPVERKKALTAIYDKLPTLNLFDPACGCGNFLVVTYRELRLLELDLIAQLFIKGGQSKGLLDVSTMIKVSVDQFYGIEIDPTSKEIATLAMWLTDHQQNRLAAARFGSTRPSIPLNKKANIHEGNALLLDWHSVIAAKKCSYIVGNPPFIGYKYQSKEQKSDLEKVLAESMFKGLKGTGVLDYVTAWHIKSFMHITANPAIKVALVSTNSITQGEQVAVLWQPLLANGLHIQFAHRTFKWSNEGSGVAAVHCVIIGFGLDKPKKPPIWDYSADISGNGKRINARQINPYLVDALTVLLDKRIKPRSPSVPEITYGSEPREGGFLLLSDEERKEVIKKSPLAKKFIRRFVSADDFINNNFRYCYWLTEIKPQEIEQIIGLNDRLAEVRKFRSASQQKAANRASEQPTLFVSIRQPKTQYLLIPIVSSENRKFIPIGYMPANVICSNANFMLSNAKPYEFGMLCSTMHNAWMRAVCGRLESRYRYSNTIVYNNYPWPTAISKEHKQAIETAGQVLLDARAKHEGKSLAWMYNPETMPVNIQAAHDAIDEAVDLAYGYDGSNDDAPRVAFLFERYQTLTNEGVKN